MSKEQKMLQELVGKKIIYICRCLDLIDIGFGKTVNENKMCKNGVLLSSHVLHLQCPFRINCLENVTISSGDLYVSIDETKKYVDLGEKNCSLFDFKLEQNKFAIIDNIVENVVLNDYGDMNIYLSNGSISVFSDASAGEESWRFMIMGDKGKHLIRTDNRYEIVY